MTFTKLVTKFHQMDPNTEDLIANGSKLNEGMVVLIEDSMLRADIPNSGIDAITRDYDRERALENNRWAKVSDVRVDLGNRQVQFTATYADGSKKSRQYALSYAWLYLLNPGAFDVKRNPMFVDQHYLMDPATEDLITKGSKLKNGMRVLIEGSALLRENIDVPLDGYSRQRALENNRWCVVSDLEIQERWDDGNDWGYGNFGGRRRAPRKVDPLISFVGVYDDGTKIKRSYADSYAWLVKKDSLVDTEIQVGRNEYATAINETRARSEGGSLESIDLEGDVITVEIKQKGTGVTAKVHAEKAIDSDRATPGVHLFEIAGEFYKLVDKGRSLNSGELHRNCSGCGTRIKCD